MNRLLPLIPTLALALLVGACSSTDSKARIQAGEDAWKQGRSEDAIRLFEEQIAEEPEDEKTRLRLARIYYEKGENNHLRQRRLLAEAAELYKTKDKKGAAQLREQAEVRKNQAKPFYDASNVHLEVLVADADDTDTIFHAALLRMRTAVFAEEWEKARACCRIMLAKGELKGTQRAKVENWLEDINRRAPKPLLPPPND